MYLGSRFAVFFITSETSQLLIHAFSIHFLYLW